MGRNVWLWNHYATAIKHGGRHFWFAKYLAGNEYIPTVFCANTLHSGRVAVDVGKDKYKVGSLEEIPFVYVKTKPAVGNGLARILNMFLFYRNLFPTAKDYARKFGEPDVIVASSVHPLTLVAGIKVAREFGISCICEIRDLWPEAIFSFGKLREKSLIGRLLVRGEYWIYRNANALIFTKEGDVDYIKERKWDTDQGGAIDLRKCHYINNGVDLKSFDKCVTELPLGDPDLQPGKFSVVYTGAIRPVNNVGNILDAAKLLQHERDIQFLIYGSGSEERHLRERVQKEGLDNVKMKGRVEKSHIPFILSSSSINLLNYSQTQYNWSRGNSSNKLFEYMASGTPIISTVKMGYCLLERYNCGISIEHSTPEELANAIVRVKNMPAREYETMSQNAREGAKDFDFEVLTRRLVKVIDAVMR